MNKGMRGARGIGVSTAPIVVERSTIGAARKAREEAEKAKAAELEAQEKRAVSLDKRTFALATHAPRGFEDGALDVVDTNATQSMHIPVQVNVRLPRDTDEVLREMRNGSIGETSSRDFLGADFSTTASTTAVAQMSVDSIRNAMIGHNVASARATRHQFTRTPGTQPNYINDSAAAVMSELDELVRSPLEGINETREARPAVHATSYGNDYTIAVRTDESYPSTMAGRIRSPDTVRVGVTAEGAEENGLAHHVVREVTARLNHHPAQLRRLSVNITPTVAEGYNDVMSRTYITDVQMPVTTIVLQGTGTPAELTEAATQRLTGSLRDRAVTRALHGAGRATVQFANLVSIGRNARWVVRYSSQDQTVVKVLSLRCDAIAYQRRSEPGEPTETLMGYAFEYIASLED